MSVSNKIVYHEICSPLHCFLWVIWWEPADDFLYFLIAFHGIFFIPERISPLKWLSHCDKHWHILYFYPFSSFITLFKEWINTVQCNHKCFDMTVNQYFMSYFLWCCGSSLCNSASSETNFTTRYMTTFCDMELKLYQDWSLEWEACTVRVQLHLYYSLRWLLSYWMEFNPLMWVGL